MAIGCPIDIGPEGYFSWLPLVLLIFTIVYLLLALAYMASKFAKNPEYESRIKVEFTRQFISLLFIFLILGFAEIMCSASFAVTGDINPFDTATEFVSKVGMVNIPENLNKLWTSSINARILSTIMFGMPSCLNGVCYTPFPVGTYVSYHLDMLGMMTSPFSASMIVQILFIDIIKKYFLALLLPLGFLLKVTPFTRDAGAFLISLALSFYFILPMFYVAGSLINDEINYSVINNIKSTIPSFSEANIMWSNSMNAYEFDNNNSLKAVGELAYYSMFAFSLPMLAVVITIAGARALFPIFSKDFIGMGDM
jgi:hypothetical protein